MEPCDPIYNLIDEDKHEEAIRYCGRVEVRNMALTQALNAYCHAYLKKYSQALEIARLVMRALPNTENVLIALNHTFKICRKDSELAAYYESLVQAYPNQQLNYLHELFSLYTIMLDSKKMQFTSQKLYKLTGQRRFVFWTVGSMLLQDEVAPTLLTVAERMLTKVLNETAEPTVPAATVTGTESAPPPPPEQPGAEELELYVEVFCRQHKFSEGLEALIRFSSLPSTAATIIDQRTFEANSAVIKASPLRISDCKVRLLELQLAHPEGSATATTQQVKSSLRNELLHQLTLLPDQWSAHARLVSLAVAEDLEIITSSAALDPFNHNSFGESRVAAHRRFLIEMKLNHPQLRGPRLAEMELLRQWRNAKPKVVDLPPQWQPSTDSPFTLPASLDSSHAQSGCQWHCEYAFLIASYLAVFERKQCCFSDIKPHLEALAVPVSVDPGRSVLPASVSQLLQALRHWALVRARTVEDELLETVRSASLLQVHAAGEEREGSGVGSGSGSGGSGGKKAGKKGNAADSKGHQLASPHSSSTTRAAEHPSKETAQLGTSARALVVERLCAAAKLRQVAVFCSKLLNIGCDEASSDCLSNLNLDLDLDLESSERRLVSLYTGTKPLSAGGVGGEREVQPGDELLLLTSAARRSALVNAVYRSYSSMVSAGSSNGEDQTLQVSFQQSSQSSTSLLLSHGSGGNMVPVLLAAARWSRLLLYGADASPHAYSFRVELLEPLRAAGCAEPALAAYNILKPKHMQHDSLSYLITPILLETGFFSECRDAYAKLNAFARQAQGETAEMMSRSFNKANYSTGLEMRQFLRRVVHSLQLHVAMCELPLLELLLSPKLMHPEAASVYLQQFCALVGSGSGSGSGSRSVSTLVSKEQAQTQGKATQSAEVQSAPKLVSGAPLAAAGPVPLLSEADVAALHDNSDYSLLVRCDALSGSSVAAAADAAAAAPHTSFESQPKRLVLSEVSEAKARRRDMELRVRVAQLTTRVLFHCLDGDVSEGKGYLRELCAVVGADDEGSTSCRGTGTLLFRYIPWSQAVSGSAAAGGPGTDAAFDGFDAVLWAAVTAGMAFALSTAAVLEAGLGNPASAAFPAVDGSGTVSEQAYASAAKGVLETLSSRRVEAVAKAQTVLKRLVGLAGAVSGASSGTKSGTKDKDKDKDKDKSRDHKFLPLPSRPLLGTSPSTLVRPLDPAWLRRVSSVTRSFTSYVPLLLQAALMSIPSHGAVGGKGKDGSKKGKGKDKDKSKGAALDKDSGASDKDKDKEGDTARLEQLSQSLGDVGTAIRSVADATLRFMENLHRELEDVEMDLQQGDCDDFCPFFAHWAAHELETKNPATAKSSASIDAVLLGPIEGGPSGAPGLAQFAQLLLSSQTQSVQRLRQILSSQMEALKAAMN